MGTPPTPLSSSPSFSVEEMGGGCPATADARGSAGLGGLRETRFSSHSASPAWWWWGSEAEDTPQASAFPAAPGPGGQESVQPGAGRAATLLFRGVSRPMWPLVPISAPFSRGKSSFREAEPSAQGPWLEGDQPGVSPAPTRPSTCPAPRSPGGSPASCLSSVAVI